VLTVDQAGISCFLPFLPMVPRRRLVSSYSARTTPRAIESPRSRLLSTVMCHSSRKYFAESFLSERIVSCVRPVLSPQARSSIETAPDGHRIVHQREVTVRCLAKCSSRAAAIAGLAAGSMTFQSASQATCRWRLQCAVHLPQRRRHPSPRIRPHDPSRSSSQRLAALRCQRMRGLRRRSPPSMSAASTR